jgi:hypothetical protein
MLTPDDFDLALDDVAGTYDDRSGSLERGAKAEGAIRQDRADLLAALRQAREDLARYADRKRWQKDTSRNLLWAYRTQIPLDLDPGIHARNRIAAIDALLEGE